LAALVAALTFAAGGAVGPLEPAFIGGAPAVILGVAAVFDLAAAFGFAAVLALAAAAFGFAVVFGLAAAAFGLVALAGVAALVVVAPRGFGSGAAGGPTEVAAVSAAAGRAARLSLRR
jgi:hypothetical protein